MTMNKRADELAVGDVWREDARLVRMTGSRPSVIPATIFIEVEDTATNERREIEFYRSNHRILE